MAHRPSKIYTRSGDDGTTSLGDGQRVSKSCLRIEICGQLEELNAFLCLTASYQNLPKAIKQFVTEIQHHIFDMRNEINNPTQTLISDEQLTVLETIIDSLDSDLPMMKEYNIPTGNAGAATCYLAKAVCRRAERNLVRLNEQEPLNPFVLKYINRLGDLLFVFAKILLRTNSVKKYAIKKLKKHG